MRTIGTGVWQLEINDSAAIVYNSNINQIRVVVDKEVKSIVDVDQDYKLSDFIVLVENTRQSLS